MRSHGGSRLACCAAVFGCAMAHATSCIVANSTLAFGGYNPVNPSPTTANATITVTCGALISASTTVPYVLLLSAGGSGSTSSRSMSGPASLPYNIYTSGGYATVWDNTTGVSGSVTIVGLLGLPLLTYGSASQTVYGRILALQPVPAGTYADTVTLTVSF